MLILMILLLVALGFLVYLFFDLVRTNSNVFYDKWTGKTAFLWVPFYALYRLIKEIFFVK